jgi:hypothetical protein
LPCGAKSISIEVNGTKVHEAEVTETHSERFFGLFRFAEQTRCRVRNLVYRGDWPKELPAVADQQLAYPEGGPYALAQNQVAEEVALPLGRPLAELEADGLKILGPKDGLSVVGNRLQVYLRNAEPNPKDWPGLELFRQIEGDVEITLDYHNMKFQKAESGWGTSLDLSIALEDPSDSQVVLGIGKNSDLTPKSIAMLRRRNLPDNTAFSIDQELISEIAETGRVRLVRRGGRPTVQVEPVATALPMKESVSGPLSVSALEVTRSEEPSRTSHAQPLPKRFTPASENCVLNVSKSPKASRIASPSAPSGAPPPSGLMSTQKRAWL